MLSRLLQGDFEGYFDEERDEPDCLWFFLHIPKTAGSSFWQELRLPLGPSHNVEVRFGPERSAVESRQMALLELITTAQSRTVRAARAHVMREDLGPLLRALPRTRLVTMLRKPVDRVVSDFRYSRTPAHPPYLDVIAKYPTLEHYVEDPVQQNKMMAYLRLHDAETAGDVHARIVREFSFVGFTEFYPICRRVLSRLLRKPRGPMTRVRTTESRPENEVRVDDALRKRMEQLNAEDQQLYALMADTFRPLRASLRTWLDQRGE